MTPAPDLAYLRSVLRSRAQLLAEGRTDRQLQGALIRGELMRLHPGWFVGSATWAGLQLVDRHLLRVLCVHETAASPPVFSHRSAAAILALPQMSFDIEKVHTLLPASSGHTSSSKVIRHLQDLDDGALQHTGFLRHTSLSRTLIDVARSTSFANAVVTGDAAMRRLVRRTGSHPEQQRALLQRRLAELPLGRGVRRARRVLQFLDYRAESPLESLFRLQFARLGFEVRMQVPVQSQNGTFYRMDFELIGCGVFFEADGRSKYFDEELRNGRSADEVLFDERQRENWVSGTTNHGIIRGGWDHAQTPEATASHLRAFGISPPNDTRRHPLLHLY